MLQEIITYLIVGGAFTLAFLKIRKKVVRSKPKRSKADFSAAVLDQNVHNCPDCVADCALRSSAPQILKGEDEEICKKTEIRSDRL